MFKKILIAEDLDSVNIAIKTLLLEMGIQEICYAQYCDEAYLKAKKAALDRETFDLLICDLSFKPDHRIEKISSGEQLAIKLKEELPELKIIINTIEDQPSIVKRIWGSGIADAYVCKDRNGLKNLRQAINTILNNKKYLSPTLVHSLNTKNLIELSNYEVALLKYLSLGYNQDEMHELLKKENLHPNSKSSIEKKLKDLREDFGAKNNPQLVSLAISLQLI